MSGPCLGPDAVMANTPTGTVSVNQSAAFPSSPLVDTYYSAVGREVARSGSFTSSNNLGQLDKITSDLPRTYIDPNTKQKLKIFVLADPTFDIPSPIDILIGADLFANALTGDRHTLGPNLPVAFGSIFGYVIMGTTPYLPLSLNKKRNDFGGLVTLFSTSAHDLHESLQRFHDYPLWWHGPLWLRSSSQT
uniref:Peptidase aspartic putative domain-containing protein n=1 Tax=Timema bartmani TaxID=61472 RepID=A0A7R9I2W8_9NEOP|nr:unnamed protein product [Timema bartmani]